LTFGVGLNNPDTLPQVFADLLERKQRVLNLSFSGYGPQQFLVELQKGRFDGVIGPQPRLFIFVTMDAHLERAACKPFWMRRGPRYTLENGQIALKGNCYEGWNLWAREWLENMASYRLFIEPNLQKFTHEDIELYIRILLASAKLAKEKYGVETLIPYIHDPRYSNPISKAGFSEDEIVQRLREGGAMVVDVSLTKTDAPTNSASKATAIQRCWRTV
jgi:hypothetical protein